VPAAQEAPPRLAQLQVQELPLAQGPLQVQEPQLVQPAVAELHL